MQALAVTESEFPADLIAKFPARVFSRGGEREIQFHWTARPRLLPVWHEGRICLLPWGNSARRGRLPPTGWTWADSVRKGKWGAVPATLTTIPANLWLCGGVWTLAPRGIRGVVVEDPESGETVAYMVIRSTDRYHRIMTRADWMPLMVGDVEDEWQERVGAV
jgi:hypothetical protein